MTILWRLGSNAERHFPPHWKMSETFLTKCGSFQFTFLQAAHTHTQNRLTSGKFAGPLPLGLYTGTRAKTALLRIIQFSAEHMATK